MQKINKTEGHRYMDVRPIYTARHNERRMAGHKKSARGRRFRVAVFIAGLLLVAGGGVLFLNRTALVAFGKKIYHSMPFFKTSSTGERTVLSFPDPNGSAFPDRIPIYYVPNNPNMAPGANPQQNVPAEVNQPPAPAAPTPEIQAGLEDLSAGSVIAEASSMAKSKSDIWWLNSGGVMLVGSKQFATNLGPLPEKSTWQSLYAKTNPTDTDGGFYPQNIFRLVTRSKWNNLSQSVYFYVSAFNFSQSKNRNESNGVLFFNRYQDGDDLYYAGLRVDGDVVIKKKIDGKYYTMAEKKFFPTDTKYDIDTNPTLMPLQTWIGLKSEVSTDSNGDVNISVYTDMQQSGDWKLALEATDKGNDYGAAPIAVKGYAGIRTDFMDVQFKNYVIEKLQ